MIAGYKFKTDIDTSWNILTSDRTNGLSLSDGRNVALPRPFSLYSVTLGNLAHLLDSDAIARECSKQQRGIRKSNRECHRTQMVHDADW